MQPDRKTIEVVSRVLDDLFGKRSYAKGSLNEIIDTRSPSYRDDLQLLQEAGITKEQLQRLMGFANVSPTSQRMIQIKHGIQGDQSAVIRNQKELSAIRDAFLKQHTKEALRNLESMVNKYDQRAVTSSGYFSRYKQVASSPAKLKEMLKREGIANVPNLSKVFREFGNQTGVIYTGAAHTVKMIKDLEAYGKNIEQYRASINASKTRGGQDWSNIGSMLGRISNIDRSANSDNARALNIGNILNMFGSRASSPYIGSSNIRMSLPTSFSPSIDPSMARKAQETIREIYKRQALTNIQAPSGGYLNDVSKLAQSNYPKVSSAQPSVTNISQPSWLQRNKSKLLDALIGIGGTAGLLGVGSSVLSGFMSSGIPLPFRHGGMIPRFDEGSIIDWRAVNARREYARGIMNEPNEHLAFFHPSSLKVIPGAEEIGNEYSVSLNNIQEHILKKFPFQTISIHNHPNIPLEKMLNTEIKFGTNSFSLEDIKFDLAHKINKSIVVSPGGKMSSFINPMLGIRKSLDIIDELSPRGILKESGLTFGNEQELLSNVAREYGFEKNFYYGHITDPMSLLYMNRGGVIPYFNEGGDYQITHIPAKSKDPALMELLQKLYENRDPNERDNGNFFLNGVISGRSPLDRFVAHKGDTPMSALSMILNDEGSSSFISLMGTAKNYRGMGLGTKLYEEAEKLARDAGKSDIRLEAASSSAANFWGKQGFEQYGKGIMPLMRKRLLSLGGMIPKFSNGSDDLVTLFRAQPRGFYDKLKQMSPDKFIGKESLTGEWFDESLRGAVWVGDAVSRDRARDIEVRKIQIAKSLAEQMRVVNLPEDERGMLAKEMSQRHANEFIIPRDLAMSASKLVPRKDWTKLSVHPGARADGGSINSYAFGGPTIDLLANLAGPLSGAATLAMLPVAAGAGAIGAEVLYGLKNKFKRSSNYNVSSLINKILGNKQTSSLNRQLSRLGTSGESGIEDFLNNRALVESIRDTLGEKSFKSQSWYKWASGGDIGLSNPIRVSDGELAVNKSMVDSIGIDNLRKLNSGDMSPLGRFNSGGLMEYDGPGTGTSDSILEDADKGPKGSDPSDIGFIIKRTSSDKIKSILGGGFNKLKGVGKYAFGGAVQGYAIGDEVRRAFDVQKGTKGINKGVYSAISKILDEVNPDISVDELLGKIFSSPEYRSSGKVHGYDKSTNSVISGSKTEKYLQGNMPVIEDLFRNIMPANVTDAQKTITELGKNEKDYSDTIQAGADKQRELNDTIDQVIGSYRGQIKWQDEQRKLGDLHRTNVLGMDEARRRDPNYMPGRELSSEMVAAFSPLGAIRQKMRGFWKDFSSEMFSPTTMQFVTKGSITRAIGGQYSTETERSKYAANRKEFNDEYDRIIESFVKEFGPLVGDKVVRQNLQVSQRIEQVNRRYRAGMLDEKTPLMKTKVEDVGVTEVSFGALRDELIKRRMSQDEMARRFEMLLQPSAKSATGLQGDTVAIGDTGRGFKPQLIEGATTKFAAFNEEVGRTAHNNTVLYKMGDILRGISWRFASLSMSAMGVYFSIQGLLMTFQQGLASIVGPLGDVDNLMKSIGMSKAFGQGIYNASDAMKDLGISTNDFIDGWKQVTNLQGTIQTFFAGIGTKVFGDKANNSEVLKNVAEAFKALGSSDSIKTYKDLLLAIAKAAPAIIPALKGITSMLQIIADNPVLIQWGAQLMMISLILQPITSGLAAMVTILGGLSTGVNLVLTLSNALGVAAGATAGVTASLVGLVAISAAILVTWEAIARVWEYFAKSETNFKPTSIAGNLFNNWVGGRGLQAFANGGVVQSEGYDQVPGSPDDTIITAKAGEIVIDPKKRKLQGFANAPGLLPSSVEATYQFNTQRDLSATNNRNTGRVAQVLGDVQESNTLAVTVKNWPDMFGNGTVGGGSSTWMGSDIGYPYHLNPNMRFSGFNPTVPTPTAFNLNEVTNPNAIVNVNPNPNINPNINANVNPNFQTSKITADAFTQYIGEVGKSIVQSTKDAVSNVKSKLETSYTSLTTGIKSAGDTIKNVISNIKQGTAVSNIKQGINTAISSVSSYLYGNGESLGMSISPNAIPSGAGVGYDNVFYSHAGYNRLGTVGNYLGQRVRRPSFMERFNEGRYQLPVMATPPNAQAGAIVGGRTPGAGMVMGTSYPHGTDFWSGKEVWKAQWQDMGEVARALASGDPLKVAKSYGSVLASNAIVGLAGRGLQYGSLALSSVGPVSNVLGPGVSSVLGRGVAQAGSMFTGANILAGNPYVIGAAGYAESGQAFDEWMKGRKLEDLKIGKFNTATGIITGGAGSALFGKGIETWGGVFGKSEEQMRQSAQANQGLFNLGFSPGSVLRNAATRLGQEQLYNDIFGGAKGGNTAVSDILNTVPLIGGALGDLNTSIYDAVAQLANIDIGTIFGGGTAAVGLGAGAIETGGNAVNMVAQNPYSALYAGLQSGLGGVLPIPGASIAMSLFSDLLMPKTAEWTSNQVYGVQDIAKGWRSTLTNGANPKDVLASSIASDNGTAISDFVTALNTFTAAQQATVNQTPQQAQPVTINATINVSGEELATKGSVTKQIQVEVPDILGTFFGRGKSRIV